jgi:hypothetical protein
LNHIKQTIANEFTKFNGINALKIDLWFPHWFNCKFIWCPIIEVLQKYFIKRYFLTEILTETGKVNIGLDFDFSYIIYSAVTVLYYLLELVWANLKDTTDFLSLLKRWYNSGRATAASAS